MEFINIAYQFISTASMTQELMQFITGTGSTIMFYIITMYLTWVAYLAIVCLKIAYEAGRVPKGMIPFVIPLVLFGYFIDIFLNTIMSIPLFELPQWQKKEFLLTTRFTRLYRRQDFRGKQARFWCKYFLEPFDPGHCTKGDINAQQR